MDQEGEKISWTAGEAREGVKRCDPDAVAAAFRMIALAIKRGEPVHMLFRGYVGDALLAAADVEHTGNQFGDSRNERLLTLGKMLGILAGHRRRSASFIKVGTRVCALMGPGNGLNKTQAMEQAASDFGIKKTTVRKYYSEYLEQLASIYTENDRNSMNDSDE